MVIILFLESVAASPVFTCLDQGLVPSRGPVAELASCKAMIPSHRALSETMQIPLQGDDPLPLGFEESG